MQRSALRAKESEISMMKRRGFDISRGKLFFGDETIEPGENPFLGGVTDREKLKGLIDRGIFTKDISSMSMEYEKGVERVAVVYLPSGNKGTTSVKDLGPLYEAIGRGDERDRYTNIVAISEGDLTSPAEAAIAKFKIHITVFMVSELQIDLFKSSAAPKSYAIWKPGQIEQFEEEEGVSSKRLMEIRSDDALVKRLGLLAGSILMTEMPLPGRNNGGSVVDYRVVV